MGRPAERRNRRTAKVTTQNGTCKIPLSDEEHPHHFCERHRLMSFADGYVAALANVQESAREGVCWRFMGRAVRRLRHRAELLTDDALPVEDFLRRVMAGDW